MSRVRTVDLALYADVLAAKAARVASQLERVRGELRRAAIERDARRALDERTLARLERLGVVSRADARRLRREVVELAADLTALRALQAWTEAQLAASGGDGERATSLERAVGAELHASAIRAEAR